MEQFNEYLAFFSEWRWVYVAIFVFAVAEASVLTSFFLSGTLGIVALGVMIAHGLLSPAATVFAVYTGTVLGDIITYFLATRLQRFRHIRKLMVRVEPVREPLATAPVRFLVVGHFTPYLRALLPVLAAGHLPPSRYLPIEACAAMASTCFFIGLGYAGSVLSFQFSTQTIVGIIGVAALLAVFTLWVRLRKPFCPLNRSRSLFWHNQRRALLFFVWYLPWHPLRWIEVWRRGKPSLPFRRALAERFPDILPGDVLLIRLTARAPWGQWAHSAIALENGCFAHGFSKEISCHSLTSLPVRHAIAHLRPKCGRAVAAKAAAFAESKVGTKFSLAALRSDRKRFSCSSLVAYAFSQSGIEIVEPGVKRIVPDDLFSSTQLELMRVVLTDEI